MQCVKSVRIPSNSGPYFPAFGLNTEITSIVRMQENTDQNNSEYGHFSHSDGDIQILLLLFRVSKCFTNYVSTGRKYLLWFSNILQNVFTKKIQIIGSRCMVMNLQRYCCRMLTYASGLYLCNTFI